MEQSVHNGHRQRLKKSMLDSDFNGIQEHVLLEALLFYSVPMCDTNETAHKLLDTFGSFGAVFEADYSDLTSVEGIGDNSAFLIKLINKINKETIAKKANGGYIIKNLSDAAELLNSKFIGEKDEKMEIMLLDNSNKVIAIKEIGRGHVNGVNVDKRKIIEQAVRCNAAGIILAHNHPHGVASPSSADIDLTRSVSLLLKNIDISLIDHIIFSDEGFCSIKANRKNIF